MLIILFNEPGFAQCQPGCYGYESRNVLNCLIEMVIISMVIKRFLATWFYGNIVITTVVKSD